MYERNKRGPRTEPNGTPQVMNFKSDILSPTETKWEGSLRYKENQSLVMPLIP